MRRPLVVAVMVAVVVFQSILARRGDWVATLAVFVASLAGFVLAHQASERR